MRNPFKFTIETYFDLIEFGKDVGGKSKFSFQIYIIKNRVTTNLVFTRNRKHLLEHWNSF